MMYTHEKKKEAMMMLQERRKRGRSKGPIKPISDRRQRIDVRLSPETLALIDEVLQHGRAPGVTTKTDLIEAAIRQYIAALNNEQLTVTPIETVKAPAQPSQQVETLPPASLSGVSRYKPSYQIFIRHETAVCPALPDSFSYREQSEEDKQCPTHEVFSRVCPIDHARRQLERLKTVPGLTRIWIAKNGYALERDTWQKEKGQWIKN